MLSTEDFEQRMEQVHASVTHDHADHKGAVCVMLHKDLGLAETKRSDDEIADMKRRAQEQFNLTDDEAEAYGSGNNGIDRTLEHHALHQAMDGIAMGAIASGLPPSQLVALLIDIGFRLGRMDAASQLDVDPSEWLTGASSPLLQPSDEPEQEPSDRVQGDIDNRDEDQV